MRWHYRDPPLVWLLVWSYAAHLAEEYLGGFPAWFVTIAGRPLPIGVFVAINAVAFVGMVLAARAAIRSEMLGWLAITIATVLLVNGLAHLVASLATGSYSPGLITGVVLYLPIAQLVLLRAWHQVPGAFFWQGVGAGVAVHGLVVVAALVGSGLALAY
ncbi:MAG TPA: HXXEE domain-containing protein [Vicinamibacterales bacterium]|nr:HXXEE domain-containing protein [Vicinamibacterales bacterium]